MSTKKITNIYLFLLHNDYITFNLDLGMCENNTVVIVTGYRCVYSQDKAFGNVLKFIKPINWSCKS